MFVGFISGCKEADPDFSFQKFEDYKFREANISAGTRVKILSFSGGPVCTPEATYYYQYIGIVEGTQDTIRVLSPCQKIPEGEPPTEGSFSPWENTSKIINDVMEKNGEKGFESQNKSIVFNKKNKELEGKDFKTAIGSLSYWTNNDGTAIFAISFTFWKRQKIIIHLLQQT